MGSTLNLSKIARALSDKAKLFDGAVAKVGIPAGKNYPDGTSIAYVAAIQEFGCPEKNIPPRSFLRSTRTKKSAEWARELAAGAQSVAQRQIGLTEMLDTVGHVAAMDVVQTFAERIPPPLKPATVEARIRRAKKANRRFGSKGVPITISQPLVDTGALIAHVSYGTGESGTIFDSGTPAK